ncbi:unnamed protein product [Rotaria magnacalcarata]|uniref:GINS complex subunit 1 n=2 Tax=Rotaria magnacalcarata TaxID=392030 RepID=A0A816N4Z0_9BILA|nr:unnamed protein product [Rotaria magnacalcarata]
MIDNDKIENLANARRKLKKFRDQQQQQQQNGNDQLTFISETNHATAHATHGISSEYDTNNHTMSRTNPHDVTTFFTEQQALLNGMHVNLSKSPVLELEEQNRQYALLIENQKQQRARLEDQRQIGGGSSVSGRSSLTQPDVDFARQIEHKYRGDLEHLQEQLEIHVQTIGILVAEKTDLSARLSQSIKQLERKQSEMDEIQGRLKGSRERVEELEKHAQNSTSDALKREMTVKESDKEIDQLKTENTRQSQIIEDLQQNLNELNGKFNNRQNIIEQLNNEIIRLKQKVEQSEIRLQQFQSINDTSVVNKFEQHIEELQRTVSLKTNETEALLSSINQMRSDYDQMHLQYQQYNANVQRHIQELNDQINQLVQTNNLLENEKDAIKQAYEMKLTQIHNDQTVNHHNVNGDLILERDSLRQENELFRSAIDQWSRQYAEIQLENEHVAKKLIEKDARIAELEEASGKVHENSMDHEKLLQTIHDDKTTISRAITQNKQLKDQLTELQDSFIKMSNDNMNLTNQIQAQEYLNKQLNERLAQNEFQFQEVQTKAHHIPNQEKPQIISNNSEEQSENTTQRLNELLEENKSLRERLAQLEQQSESKLVDPSQLNDSSSLSSLTAGVDDTHQPQNGFVDKIIQRFNRAMRDNADLQDRTQQLEHLILQLQSETDTIGDYISLYQQQRQHLHRRYQEKDDYIKQLSHDRLSLQRKLSELETLLMRGLNKPSTDITNQKSVNNEAISSDKQQTADENEWPEMVDNVLSSSSASEQTTTSNNDKLSITASSTLPSLSNFDEETRRRILTLLKELGESDSSSAQTDNSSTTKLAFVGKNLYMLASKAHELIKELDRSRDTILPPYNADTIRHCQLEANELFRQNYEDVQTVVQVGADNSSTNSAPTLMPTISIRHAAIQRIKRCLLAYAYHRMNKIKSFRWSLGPVLPEYIRNNLSIDEIEFFSNYNQTLSSYMRSIGNNHSLDLTSFMIPPKKLFAHIKCIQEYGPYETSDGTIIQLTFNSEHYVLTLDAEHLIQRKIAEHIV